MSHSCGRAETQTLQSDSKSHTLNCQDLPLKKKMNVRAWGH